MRFIAKADKSVVSLLRIKRSDIFDWISCKIRLAKALRGIDIAIVDSYLANNAVYEEIAAKVRVLACIDDNNRLHYPANFVINGSVGAELFDYKYRKNTKYLLGTKYVPLRKEFRDVPIKKINRNISRIMVTFGGDDSKGMTIKVMRLLDQLYPGIIKDVIIGPAFKNINALKKFKNKFRLIFYPGASEMKKIMLSADVAISSGGQTLYELARIGLPTIAIAVAENQLNNVYGWRRRGFIKYAGYWNNKIIFTNLKNCLESLLLKRTRLKMSLAGRSLVDGLGAERIVSILLGEEHNEDN